VRLVLRGYRILGGVSLLALTGGIWGWNAIGPGSTPGLWAEYLAVATALLWFAALSILLLTRGWIAQPDRNVDAARTS
jgi:hypothetical protein